MTDLTKRLRQRAGEYDEYAWHREIELEAADEIDKLQSALYDLSKHIWRGDWQRLKPETRDVMEGIVKEMGEKE